MSQEMLLEQAARVLRWGFGVTEWPDALTIDEIATLESTDGASSSSWNGWKTTQGDTARPCKGKPWAITGNTA